MCHAAAAQDADDYRGGWRTDKGEAHTYEFSIRGDQVRGIYCTYCADATTLAFIDGSFGADGITFVVTHVNADGGTAYQDRAKARFDHGNLIVTGVSGAPGGGKFERILIKDSRGPDPLPVIVSRLPKAPPVAAVAINQQGLGAPRPRYIQPGPWKTTLTGKDVIGVWLGFGVGAPKQYFIIRKVGTKLRGMVCGTCDNPYTMAALDDFAIQGDTLRVQHPPRRLGRRGACPRFISTSPVMWDGTNCGARPRRTISRHHDPCRLGSSPASRSQGPLQSRLRPEIVGPNGRREILRCRISNFEQRDRAPQSLCFPRAVRGRFRKREHVDHVCAVDVVDLRRQAVSAIAGHDGNVLASVDGVS